MTGTEEVKSAPPPLNRETRRLMLLFGAMYLVQGIAEPTEGLIAQPVRSLLKSWGYTAAGIAGFGALLSLPWSLKPLYGLLTDFVPLAGTRRRSYLMLTSGVSCLAFACLYACPIPTGGHSQLLVLLLIPTIGVAFADVVVDALMIESGQPRGLTGTLQSVQWAAMYAGSIAAGLVGGYLSEHGRQQDAFLICAITSAATLAMSFLFVRENTHVPEPQRFARATRELLNVLRNRRVQTVAMFLVLWSFNPFGMSILYLHLTQQLGLSEQFYGVTVSTLSAGAILGSVAYGLYCRRVPMTWLIHLSIAAGVLSTLAYCCVVDETSAAIISFVVGFAYITGCMVQYDLAAQICPVIAAGTTFALLMSLSNLSLALSAAIGGRLYSNWLTTQGATMAFNLLVVAGALSSSTCWLLVPWLKEMVSVAPRADR